MSQIIMQVTNLSKDLTFNTKINPKRKKGNQNLKYYNFQRAKKFNNQTQKLLKLGKKKKKCMTAKKREKRDKSGYPQIANQPIKFRH